MARKATRSRLGMAADRLECLPDGMRSPAWRWQLVALSLQDPGARLSDVFPKDREMRTACECFRAGGIPDAVHRKAWMPYVQARDIFVRGSSPMGRRWMVEAMLAGGATDGQIAEVMGDIPEHTVAVYVKLFHDIRPSLGSRMMYETRVRPVGDMHGRTSGAVFCDMGWKLFAYDWGWEAWRTLKDRGQDDLTAEQRQWFERFLVDMRSEALTHAAMLHDAGSPEVQSIVQVFGGRSTLGLIDAVDTMSNWMIQELAVGVRKLHSAQPRMLGEGDAVDDEREEIPESVRKAASRREVRLVAEGDKA